MKDGEHCSSPVTGIWQPVKKANNQEGSGRNVGAKQFFLIGLHSILRDVAYCSLEDSLSFAQND